jgi:hypothetical protein
VVYKEEAGYKKSKKSPAYTSDKPRDKRQWMKNAVNNNVKEI